MSVTCCPGLRVDGKPLQDGGWGRMAVLMGLIEKEVAGDPVCIISAHLESDADALKSELRLPVGITRRSQVRRPVILD